ncbi:MAG: carbohydrate kinase, partial [Lachnospiraceae bacterium]|nr:carbohydrate kinase [Lachnospiraceae bacterium]
FKTGALHVHTDEENECERILEKLLELDLLADTNDVVCRSIYDITVFGEILIDFTWQGVNDAGQTLFAQNPGGAPANVAVGAARLGAHTAFLGKAGADMHGEFLRATLQKEKVDTKGMILDPRYFTTLAFVNISSKGERTFSFARKPGADTRMQKEEMDIDILDHTCIFHVGSLSLTENPSRDTTFYAVKRAQSKGSIISYDPNYRASLWENETVAKQHMRSLIPYADLMKISDEETELLTGKKAPEAAAAALFQQGVKVVAVTLGSEGAYIYCKDGGRKVPGYPSKAVDTNGAGDSFWGSFLCKIAASGKRPEEFTLDELAEYARFANAAASLCVEKKGAIPAMPDLVQVEERV